MEQCILERVIYLPQRRNAMHCTTESTKLIDSIRVVGTAAAAAAVTGATDDDGDDNDGAVAAKWISF